MDLITDVIIDPISVNKLPDRKRVFTRVLCGGILFRGSPVVRIANASGRVKYLNNLRTTLIYLFTVNDSSEVHQLNPLIGDHLENVKSRNRIIFAIAKHDVIDIIILHITIKTDSFWFATCQDLIQQSSIFERGEKRILSRYSQ